jgi:hypothetical protein
MGRLCYNPHLGTLQHEERAIEKCMGGVAVCAVCAVCVGGRVGGERMCVCGPPCPWLSGPGSQVWCASHTCRAGAGGFKLKVLVVHRCS